MPQRERRREAQQRPVRASTSQLALPMFDSTDGSRHTTPSIRPRSAPRVLAIDSDDVTAMERRHPLAGPRVTLQALEIAQRSGGESTLHPHVLETLTIVAEIMVVKRRRELAAQSDASGDTSVTQATTEAVQSPATKGAAPVLPDATRVSTLEKRAKT